MALVVPRALLCRVFWTQPLHMDHAPQNVFGIIDDDTNPPLTQAAVNAFATHFDTAFVAAGFASSIPSSCDPSLIQVTDIRSATGPQFTAPLTPASTGTADPLPGEVSLVTSIKTALRGRSFRGRWYWPSFVESTNDSTGRPTSALATSCTTFFTSFDSGINSVAGWDGLGVISRSLLTITEATSFATNQAWDSQRRRGFR